MTLTVLVRLVINHLPRRAARRHHYAHEAARYRATLAASATKTRLQVRAGT